MIEEKIEQAKQFIEEADAVLITAGAGMGVDSGLPDFRGKNGFWKAYPVIEQLGLDFEDIANPGWFANEPNLAWAFYGHRLHLYRATNPHAGFRMLLALAKEKDNNYFVYTSNVDGQFQKAGFDQDKIVEVHGSIHHVQCSGACKGILKANNISVEIDMDIFQALTTPLCKKCGDVLRPNILMFCDCSWNNLRSNKQEVKYEKWLKALIKQGKKLLIIEMGAGKDISTVRMQSEAISQKLKAKVIRINPRDSTISDKLGIGLDCGALVGLEKIFNNINSE